MKILQLAIAATSLLGLAACASDGSPDAQAQQDAGEILDFATQLLNLATQAVQTFSQ